MSVAFGHAVTATRNQSFPGSRSGTHAGYDLDQYAPSSIHPTDPAIPQIRRFDPPAQVIQCVETGEIRCELIAFEKGEAAELEVLMSCHLVILFPDGISRGCEWSNGRDTQKLHSVAPNATMINPAHEYLRIRASKPQNYCRVLMLTIRPTAMSRLGDPNIDPATLRFPRQIDLNDQGIREALVAIQEEIETPGLGNAFYVETLFSLLLTRLMRFVSNFATRRPAYVKGGLPNWRLKQAIELLEEDELARAPSLIELAKALGLHPASFCRAFKQSMGVSPHRYLLAHRVSRAKEMMKDQNRSLTQIALDCGFSGSAQLSVVFRRIAGMPPREYRRSL